MDVRHLIIYRLTLLKNSYVCAEKIQALSLYMLKLNEIKKPIAEQLDLCEGKFKQSMQSSVPLLDRIIRTNEEAFFR